MQFHQQLEDGDYILIQNLSQIALFIERFSSDFIILCNSWMSLYQLMKDLDDMEYLVEIA